MGDRTNLDMLVVSKHEEIRVAARELFENYSGGGTYEDDEGGHYLYLGANECSCGSSDGLAGDLDKLIEETGIEFAYKTHEDPAYEWLGSAVIHVPGIEPDFHSTADSYGNTVLTHSEIERIVDAAGDDTGPLAGMLRREIGTAHRAALTALREEKN